MAAMYQAIPEDILLSITENKMAKEAWDAIKTMCLGADKVKKTKAQTLRAEFESMTVKETEQLDDFCLSGVSKTKARKEHKSEVNLSQTIDDEPTLLVLEYEGNAKGMVLLNEDALSSKIKANTSNSTGESNIWEHHILLESHGKSKRFHTKKRDVNCSTQNSGVILTALTTNFASFKDKYPIVGDVTYYGAIEEIIEVDYWGAITVVLFWCCWYEKDKDCYGLHASISLKRVKRMICIDADILKDISGPIMHDTEVNIELENQNDDVSRCRDDIVGEMCLELSSGDEADDEIFK
ncbi:hypothetical protein AgCh_035895 [Apium graveolens]